MPKLSTKELYDSINKMSLKKTDILLVKVNASGEDVEQEDMEHITESVAALSDLLKENGIGNPIIVLGPDANISLIDESIMNDLGYYKKDIAENDLDKYYD